MNLTFPLRCSQGNQVSFGHLTLAKGTTKADLGLHYLDFFHYKGEIETFTKISWLTTILGACQAMPSHIGGLTPMCMNYLTKSTSPLGWDLLSLGLNHQSLNPTLRFITNCTSVREGEESLFGLQKVIFNGGRAVTREGAVGEYIYLPLKIQKILKRADLEHLFKW